ncbi:hypothetical protein C6P46_001993 [Rhodotorula mucilaginosa]|uniref:Uncharacterized protein n=1 Tax=Rhodotorula mucilaginosa TaxID=5537 RepID=A0A9P6VUA5_RHOMI|nr:hypothetical protein C6P46_001993 [Rhodotorula mucilaginosa]
MGTGGSSAKQRKTRKFADVKRMVNPKDMRLKANQEKQKEKEEAVKAKEVNRVDAMPTSLFFSHNQALVPPYRVIVDTNFINLSLENRVDMVRAMMDVLYAKGSLFGNSGEGCEKCLLMYIAKKRYAIERLPDQAIG